MQPTFDPKRREFLRGAVRYGALGGMLGGVGFLVAAKGSGTQASDGPCSYGGVCGTCAAREGCAVEQAMAARKRAAE